MLVSAALGLHQPLNNQNRPGLSLDETQKLIASHILDGRAFLAGRVGSTEAKAVSHHALVSNLTSLGDIPDGVREFMLRRSLSNLRKLSGVYPETIQQLEKFSAEYLSSVREIDLLGSWSRFESFLLGARVPSVTALENLEPFFTEDPWTRALRGKTVLVVHPFSESIERQHARRHRVFRDSPLAESFDLITVKAPQTLGGSRSYKSWHDALGQLIERLTHEQADVALVGCGAYGLPVSSFLKSTAMPVIHLGGALQLLFGITGKRWRSSQKYAALLNEYWVSPSPAERPSNFQDVDGGVYW